jgi:hypothetical protein
MSGLTGGDWKRAATSGTAPVPDPPHLGFDLGLSPAGTPGLTVGSRLAIMRL